MEIIRANFRQHDLWLAEKRTIDSFICEHKHLLDGYVLDYGCGEQPYKKYVSGTYYGYDPDPKFCHQTYPIDIKWDAIICTQVLQTTYRQFEFLDKLNKIMKQSGILLLTFTTIPILYEQNTTDKFHTTLNGAKQLLSDTGFVLVDERNRWIISCKDGLNLNGGYGITARRRNDT
jgi:hypothetical protein